MVFFLRYDSNVLDVSMFLKFGPRPVFQERGGSNFSTFLLSPNCVFLSSGRLVSQCSLMVVGKAEGCVSASLSFRVGRHNLAASPGISGYFDSFLS